MTTNTQPAFFENGVIKDIGPDMPVYPEAMIAQVPLDAQKGWTWDGTTAAPIVALAATPPNVSRRQFFQQLAIGGFISQAEALAAMAGTIPSELMTLINTLPQENRFAAQMLVSGATQFDRENPFTIELGAGYNLTSAQIDALWAAASAL